MTIEPHQYSRTDAHALVNHLRRSFDITVGAVHEDSGQFRIDMQSADDDIFYWMDDRIWLVWPVGGGAAVAGEGLTSLLSWLNTEL